MPQSIGLPLLCDLDASVHQSGDFTGTKNKLSKRGSPYFRHAIWQAVFISTFKDPSLSQYYQKLRARGHMEKILRHRYGGSI
ncbi:transposase [Enterococcus faecium]|uniref:transposase n=1 Tax=Enterococcus faecium TaxID=1352 RepID=UPI001C4F5CCC|nr:transposase [Enterococcus faecium]